jgi:hypothetical protein
MELFILAYMYRHLKISKLLIYTDPNLSYLIGLKTPSVFINLRGGRTTVVFQQPASENRVFYFICSISSSNPETKLMDGKAVI